MSEPFLPDPNFKRTVILLCANSKEGSFGLVLNQSSTLFLNDVVEEIDDFREPLFIGGPVEQNTLHYIHRGDNPLEGSEKLSDGLFWGGSFDRLLELINVKEIRPQDFKFFVGYAGWGAGQLESEVKEGSWFVSKSATPDQVFDTNPDDLWRDVLREMGGKYKMYSNYPIDPRMN
ncbi:YqgE/AlgH family protein [Cytophagales bacterium RKSG123]|nr:YqgE/AlgH family protein [Xanthovirga aplysinae]